MLQILSFIPGINCYLPPNLETFLTEYLNIGNLVFPFQLLPDWIPNPLSWLSYYLMNPISTRFSLCGYESISFIYNFGAQLFTWVLLFIGYLILTAITKLFPEPKCMYFHKWKKEYEYNVIFRVIIECYLQMSFCAILNLWNVNILYIIILFYK